MERISEAGQTLNRAASALIELTCVGSHREMGRAQGRWLGLHRKEILQALAHNQFAPFWIQWGGSALLQSLLSVKGLFMEWSHLPNLRKFAPSQVERMRGMAEGAEIPFNLMLGLASIESLSASFSFVLGCTSIAVGKSRSKSKGPLIGYNHDFSGFFREHLLVRRSQSRNCFPSVQLTYPSLPGAIAGINDAGVAVTLNHAYSMEPENHGVPPTLLVQEALDHCRNTDEVRALFKKAVVACGSIVTVVDEKGAMIALELSRGRFGARKPRGDLSLTLNRYQLSRLKQIEVPQQAKFHPRKFPKPFRHVPIHLHNWERRRRFEELLSANSPLGPKDLKRYLSDHDGSATGGLGTICRHHPTADTIASAIFYPRERRLEAARGFACQAQYQAFSL